MAIPENPQNERKYTTTKLISEKLIKLLMWNIEYFPSLNLNTSRSLALNFGLAPKTS